MLTKNDYLHLAHACVELADQARDPERSMLLQLARAWYGLADEGYILMPSDPAGHVRH